MSAKKKEDDLDQYVQRRAVALARVEAVAYGYSAGCYLFGRAGVGKSYAVNQHLERIGAKYRVYGGHMTGLGLFRALEARPDSILVLDDLELLLRDKTAQVILRQATWAADGPRVVEYATANNVSRVEFTGGLVLIGNTPIGTSPVLDAVASRLQPVEYVVSDDECAAVIRQLAETGKYLSKAARREVAEFVIKVCSAHSIPLDLRRYRQALDTRRQFDMGHMGVDWRNVVESNITGFLRTTYQTKAAQVEEQIQLVVRIDQMPERAKVARFEELTGQAEPTYWRRRREAVKRCLLPSRAVVPVASDVELLTPFDDDEAA